MEKSKTAAALIAAHRAALQRANKAEQAQQAVRYPEGGTNITIFEIGVRCTVYDEDRLDRAVQEHITNSGLKGLELHEFKKRIFEYRTILQMKTAVYDRWKAEAGIDAINDEWTAADDDLEACWKALMAHIKTNKRDLAEIARYIAGVDSTSRHGFYKPREALKQIAAALGGGK